MDILMKYKICFVASSVLATFMYFMYFKAIKDYNGLLKKYKDCNCEGGENNG